MRDDIARLLLKAGSVTLSPQRPFTWASGIKSPIYCDNRILLSFPKIRNEVIREFDLLIKKGKIKCDAIAGIATAGIPHAAILADRLKKPLLYVRPQAKAHGKKNQIEGRLEKGSRVLVIEDLVSTAQSCLAAITALRKSGALVRHCLAIFSYGLPVAQKAFEKAQCQLYTLTNLETLLTVAMRDSWITQDEKVLIQQFSQDPKGWLMKTRRPQRPHSAGQ